MFPTFIDKGYDEIECGRICGKDRITILQVLGCLDPLHAPSLHQQSLIK